MRHSTSPYPNRSFSLDSEEKDAFCLSTPLEICHPGSSMGSELGPRHARAFPMVSPGKPGEGTDNGRLMESFAVDYCFLIGRVTG